MKGKVICAISTSSHSTFELSGSTLSQCAGDVHHFIHSWMSSIIVQGIDNCLPRRVVLCLHYRQINSALIFNSRVAGLWSDVSRHHPSTGHWGVLSARWRSITWLSDGITFWWNVPMPHDPTIHTFSSPVIYSFICSFVLFTHLHSLLHSLWDSVSDCRPCMTRTKAINFFNDFSPQVFCI